MNNPLEQSDGNSRNNQLGSSGLSPLCLNYIECIQVIKSGNPPQSFQEANSKIQSIVDSPSFPSLFIEIFNNVTDPYILFMTATSMKNKIGFVDKSVIGDLEELKLFILRYLHDHINTYSEVVKSLCNLVGRIVKVCWLKDLRQRGFLDQLHSIFDNTFFMQKMKLEILIETVVQMNDYDPSLETRSIHRSSSIIFSSRLLLPIFSYCLSILPISSEQQEIILTPELICLYETSLKLITACLSYDFCGTVSGSSDEVELLQLPSEWSETVCQPQIITTLFAIYNKEPLSLAITCSESILYFIAIRRSLFPSPQSTMAYYYAVFLGLLSVLTNHTHLEDSQCHSFISQCLAKFKTCTQLSELLKFPEILPFYTQVSSFAISTIQESGYLGDFPYILLFWSRIVDALRYTSSPVYNVIPEHIIKESIQNVCQVYIDTFINRVDYYLENDMENPLQNTDMISKYEEKIAVVMNFDFSFVYACFQPYLMKYKTEIETFFKKIEQGQALTPESIKTVDACLAWCIFIISMSIKKQIFSDYQIKNNHHIISANLSSQVFSLLSLFQYNEHISLPYYFPNLYTVIPIFLQAFCFILFDYKLKTVTTSSTEDITQTGSSKLIAYRDFFNHIGSGEPVEIINSLILFLLNSLLQSPLSTTILTQLLSLFSMLCHNPHTQRILIYLDSMKKVVQEHSTYHFPALEDHANGRYRTQFYTSLTEAMLICAVPGDLDLFALSLSDKLTKAVQEMDIQLITSCYRDLTGVVRSCLSSYQYLTVYDILFLLHFSHLTLSCPNSLQIIYQLLPSYWNQFSFTIAAFRFIQELALNRKDRIDANDPTPRLILFFRNISTIIQSYLTLFTQSFSLSDHKFIQLPAPAIKTITLIYTILSNIFNGCYIPFGAMIFYQDNTLSNLLIVLSQLISFIPIQDLYLLPKLSSSIYSFLNDLFSLNTLIVSYLQPDVFQLYLRLILSGVSSENEVIVKKSASTLDSLATFMYINRKGNLSTFTRIQQLIGNPANFWTPILKEIFDALLLSKVALQWDLSRPLLSVFLVYEDGLNAYCQYLCEGCNESQVAEIQEIFKDFLKNVDRSLDNSSREGFSMLVGKWCRKLAGYAIHRDQL